MAPAPVVSCAAADVTARVNTAATSTTDTRECRRDERSRCFMVSRHPSADPHEFLLVCVVVGKDQSSRADECGVTHGAATARPELSLLREILDDRAKLALLRFPRRCRGQSEHQRLCAGRRHALDNFTRRKIGTEI